MVSTIGEEKQFNPRLTKSRAEFTDIMTLEVRFAENQWCLRTMCRLFRRESQQIDESVPEMCEQQTNGVHSQHKPQSNPKETHFLSLNQKLFKPFSTL